MKYLLIVLSVCFFSSGLFADTTFVSGTIVNETWTPAGSPYCVVDSVFIASLTINPGVRIVFLGNYVFRVSGIITALGEPGDTIVFTRANPTVSWGGIKFNNNQPGSILRYCRIEYSNNSGIHIINSTPVIENCVIFGNSAQSGAGVRIILNAANPLTLTLSDCLITGNSSTTAPGNCAVGNHGGGGGVMATITTGLLIIKDSKIVENNSGSTSSYGSRSGAGLHLTGQIELIRDTIENNSCYSYCCPCSPGSCTSSSRGAGIYANGTITIQCCIIRENYAWAQACFTGSGVATGSGLYFAAGTLSMENTAIFGNTTQGNGSGWTINSRSGVVISSGEVSIVNCAIAYHSNLGLTRYGGSVAVTNSILFFNAPGQFFGDSVLVTYSDVEAGLPGIGNIDVNPVFASPTDLRIVPPSLCIDAGNPDSIYNDGCRPPGLGEVRNDMGAHGGPGACVWIDSTVTNIENSNTFNFPIKFSLCQNYPNPFNPSTRIKYSVQEMGFVTLKVYDVLGNEVATLVNQEKPAGSYEVEFEGNDLTSGIYFYKLQVYPANGGAGTFVETKKMVLLR
jgi:hypothetical protein